MPRPNNRRQRLLAMLRSTNGGAVSQDIILAVLWPNRGIDLSDPNDAVRHLVWKATRGTDIRVRQQSRKDGYVLYQIHA